MENQVKEILLNNKKQAGNQAEDTNREPSSLMEEIVPLYSDALKNDNINDFLGDHEVEFISLVGFADVGKSTFLGSLYSLLLTYDSLGEYRMVDSDTFVGFEKKLYLRRLNPNETSEIKRTLRNEGYHLTLLLVNKLTNKTRKLVICDKAGEIYQDYISKDEEIEKDFNLPRADRLLFFIDVQKMLGNQFNLMLDDYAMMLKRLLKFDKISSDSTKYLVFNKFDQVKEDNHERYEKRKEKVLECFRELLGDGINPKEITSMLTDVIKPDEANEFYKELITPFEPDTTEPDPLCWAEYKINKYARR